MKFAKTNKIRSRRQSSFALVHLDALTTNSPGEEGKMPPSTPKVVKKEKYAWQKLCEAIHSGDDFQGTNEESHRLEEVFMFVFFFFSFFLFFPTFNFFSLSIFCKSFLWKNYFVRDPVSLESITISGSVTDEIPNIFNHTVIIGKDLNNLFDLIRPLREKYR